MKKFLSLVLALVMTMSLVTVSAGAKDFTDSSKINYAEAVDVMSAVKVIDGYADGSFNPSATLTRGAAAKIICNLILGPTTASALVADAAPYKDVPTNHTFAGYIAYCQKTGIISGYADGTFKPANSLTGYAFMKMLLGALGYKADVEGYTGPNWSINVAKQAINAGLNKGLKGDFNGVKAVNREEACLYAFNTLKATMVEYDTTITIGGVTVAGARKDVTNNASIETIKPDDKMQFAERYFTKLTAKADTDAFERPATTWSNGKEKIGTFVDYTLMVAEYTTAASGKELYDVTGKNAFNDYKFYSYVDGVDSDLYKEISKNNKKDVTSTGNGALTQVFVDNDAEEVVVTVVNTYLAQATGDYNTKKDTVSYDIFGASKSTKGTVSGEDFAIEGVKDEDFALVTYSWKTGEDAIQSIADVETIADTEITSFKSGKSGNLTVGGTKYDYSKTAAYKDGVLDLYTGETTGAPTNLKDITYNIYVDQYGYVIGVEEVEAATNYVFITGLDTGNSNLTSKDADAYAIFTDGTSKSIKVNMKDSKDASKKALEGSSLLNSWFTYTVNKNDVYTLTEVSATAPAKKGDVAQGYDEGGNTTNPVVIDKKHISLTGTGSGAYNRVYGNDASVYILADLDVINAKTEEKNVAIISGVDEVVTGVKNASFNVWDKDMAYADNQTAADKNSVSYGAYTLYKGNGYIIASVIVGESDTISSNLAYVVSEKVSSESYNKTTGMWTWTRTVVINGEEVEVTESNDTGLSVLKGLTQYGWYTLKYDADNNVKKTEAPKDVVTTVAAANTAIEADKDTIVLDGATATTVYSLKGSTLYDVTNNKEGFLVAENVKVVLTQTYKLKETTTYDQGIKVLEAALKNLNEDSAGDHKYTLDAVIEDGIATTVIIVDSGKDVTPVGPNGSGSTQLATVTLNAQGKIGLVGKNGAGLAGEGMAWTLYMRSVSQDTFNVAMNGKDIKAEYMTVENYVNSASTGYAFYIVVDGVQSNTVAK